MQLTVNRPGTWRSFALAAVVLVTLAATTGSAGAAACSNAMIAEKAGGAMIAAAKAGSASGFASALRSYADMHSITVFAIGKHRKTLPNGRLGELVTVTTDFVSRTFEGYRLKFRAESQTDLDCRGDKVTGRLNFLGGRPPQQITWRIKNGKVVDVNVQRIWLSQLLREHFDTLLSQSQGDVDALFSALRK